MALFFIYFCQRVVVTLFEFLSFLIIIFVFFWRHQWCSVTVAVHASHSNLILRFLRLEECISVQLRRHTTAALQLSGSLFATFPLFATHVVMAILKSHKWIYCVYLRTARLVMRNIISVYWDYACVKCLENSVIRRC